MTGGDRSVKNIILGTAGHIDHGKTAFIRALTGIECDRLEEEKRRGITIVLGYAHLTLPSGVKVGIVDVPGHERFVNRMVAGAAGIDVVALVIAADEGVKPQTVEHLHICRILGIERGIVVLNKRDLVDDDLLFLLREEVRDLVRGTFLEDAPVVAVSSVTGEGLHEFIAALEEVAAAVREKPLSKPFRMPVDAVLTITGFGAVVRGTVLSGSVAVGEEVEILPSDLRSRIRGLQNHGRTVAEGRAGERLAINLPDATTEDLKRGMVVARPGIFRATRRVLCLFDYLPYNKKPLKTVSHGQFHCLAAKVNARMELVGVEKVPPGGRAPAVVSLDRPLSCALGDPFVIRGYGMFTTVGGGRILHPLFPEGKETSLSPEYLRVLSSGTTAERISLLAAEAGREGLEKKGLAGILNENPAEIDQAVAALGGRGEVYEDEGGLLFHGEVVGAVRRLVGVTVADYHRRNYLRAGVNREELSVRVAAPPRLFRLALGLLLAEGELQAEGELIKARGFHVTDGPVNLLLSQVEDLYRRYGLRPEDPDASASALKLDRRRLLEALNHLCRTGRLIRLNAEYYLHREHLEAARSALKNFFKNNEILTPNDVRDLLGLTRRHIIPLLEYLDGVKFTARTPAGRRLLKG